MDISNLLPVSFEEKGTNYSISVNDYVVDIKIFNALGLVEFNGRHPIFRDARINELIFFYQEILKKIPHNDLLIKINDELNEKLKTILLEKNISYRIQFSNFPASWAGKKLYIRNYQETNSNIPDQDLEDGDLENPEALSYFANLQICSVLSESFSNSKKVGDKFYISCTIPLDRQNQNEVFVRPLGLGGGGSQPQQNLTPVVPFSYETPSNLQINFNNVPELDSFSQNQEQNENVENEFLE